MKHFTIPGTDGGVEGGIAKLDDLKLKEVDLNDTYALSSLGLIEGNCTIIQTNSEDLQISSSYSEDHAQVNGLAIDKYDTVLVFGEITDDITTWVYTEEYQLIGLYGR